MKRLIAISLILLVAVALIALAGCRKQEAAEPKIPHVQSETTPKQLKKGPDTEVSEGMSLDAYVTKYYQAYKDKRWEEAYQMQSAGRKAQENLQAFIQARSGMPLESFKVAPPTMTENSAEVKVELQLSGMSGGQPWITTWMFTKKGGKWVVEGTKSAMKQ